MYELNFTAVLQKRSLDEAKAGRLCRWFDGRNPKRFSKLDDVLLERRQGHVRSLSTCISSLPVKVSTSGYSGWHAGDGQRLPAD